jgi:7-carboxy-7-deazaguanine synthase
LVEWVLEEPLPQAKVSLQLHKWIWDPAERGV